MAEPIGREKQEYLKWYKNRFGKYPPAGQYPLFDMWKRSQKPAEKPAKELPELSLTEYKSRLKAYANNLVAEGTWDQGTADDYVDAAVNYVNQLGHVPANAPGYEILINERDLALQEQEKKRQEGLLRGEVGRLDMEQAELERQRAAKYPSGRQRESIIESAPAKSEAWNQTKFEFEQAKANELASLTSDEDWITRYLVEQTPAPSRDLDKPWHFLTPEERGVRLFLGQKAGYEDYGAKTRGLLMGGRTAWDQEGSPYPAELPETASDAWRQHYGVEEKEWESIKAGTQKGGDDMYRKPTTPPTPEWLPRFAPWLTAGKPITRGKMEVPSPQTFATLTPSQTAKLSGYANWAGGASLEDLYSEMQKRIPGQPAGAKNKYRRPIRQWG